MWNSAALKCADLRLAVYAPASAGARRVPRAESHLRALTATAASAALASDARPVGPRRQDSAGRISWRALPGPEPGAGPSQPIPAQPSGKDRP